MKRLIFIVFCVRIPRFLCLWGIPYFGRWKKVPERNLYR